MTKYNTIPTEPGDYLEEDGTIWRLSREGVWSVKEDGDEDFWVPTHLKPGEFLPLTQVSRDFGPVGNMTKRYVKINGEKLYLNDRGMVTFAPVNVPGLEIHEDDTSFEDLPDGIYQANVDSHSEALGMGIVFKRQSGEWYSLSKNRPTESGAVVTNSLKAYHARGDLFQLHTKEATNA